MSFRSVICGSGAGATATHLNIGTLGTRSNRGPSPATGAAWCGVGMLGHQAGTKGSNPKAYHTEACSQDSCLHLVASEACHQSSVQLWKPKFASCESLIISNTQSPMPPHDQVISWDRMKSIVVRSIVVRPIEYVHLHCEKRSKKKVTINIGLLAVLCLVIGERRSCEEVSHEVS